jgi:conjugative transfer signal peptidase TraF
MRKRATLSFSPHRRWPLLLTALSAGVAVLANTLGLRINTTASMPIGLYRVVQLRLKRGAWVVFCLPEEAAHVGLERAYLHRGPCPGGSQELIKEIAALPGDRVTLSPSGLTVNGSAIPGAALHTVDRARRMLAHAPFGEKVVSPGELWVLGVDHRMSWDSRYFGPVPVDRVRAAAIPLLTFDPPLPGTEAADVKTSPERNSGQ